MVTKSKIEEQKLLANAESYFAVLPDADTFEANDDFNAAIEALDGSTYDAKFGRTYVNSAVTAKAADGSDCGYVISVTSADGFDGNITLSVGLTSDGTVTGIAFTELNETAGMGMRADEEEFKSQFNGKKADAFVLNKQGNSSADNEIDSVSGASVTSSAVVNAVNTALAFYAENVQEGGDKEMKQYSERIYNGIIKENPALILMLGMCPTMAVTTSAINGLGMGLSTLAVLIFSNMIISALRNLIPDQVRLPAYIVIVASLVTVVDLLMQAYTPGIYSQLGIYIPLIVVNCIILGRAEAYANKVDPDLAFFDGLGMGLGFTIALVIIGLLREFLGAGTAFGKAVLPSSVEPIGIFVKAPGAF
ncbi:MAG: electron transport complex subunit RsxE, partial [Eubacteriales bacterium]|nr:electron transport complex subunit RsxE [Eubacteriales bacterium]